VDVFSYNRDAWNRKVAEENRWTRPVDRTTIRRARADDWSVLLTPTKPVPRSWFPSLRGQQILCLASGGGQQGPIFAAAGAHVSVFDASPRQLEQDRQVAEREGLAIETIEGDMTDLAAFSDNAFDLVFHPCSNSFLPDVKPVWQECFRVLKGKGILLAGFTNPVRYMFEEERFYNGNLTVRYPIPYSDLVCLTDEERQKVVFDKGEPLEFGHTLQDQIGGQLEAGFLIAGFYEDRYAVEEKDPISGYLSTFIATRAVKPASGEDNDS
jgi:SAM-dependent methyltransferase